MSKIASQPIHRESGQLLNLFKPNNTSVWKNKIPALEIKLFRLSDFGAAADE